MPQPLDITVSISMDGSLPQGVSRAVRDYLKLYAGGTVCIRISRPKRSTQANAYYWSQVIDPIWTAMLEAGVGQVETINPVTGESTVSPLTQAAVHAYFKHKYLPVSLVQVGDVTVTREPTTTKLDSTQFSEYMDAIRTDELTLSLGVVFEDHDEMESFTIYE